MGDVGNEFPKIEIDLDVFYDVTNYTYSPCLFQGQDSVLRESINSSQAGAG